VALVAPVTARKSAEPRRPLPGPAAAKDTTRAVAPTRLELSCSAGSAATVASGPRLASIQETAPCSATAAGS
jgi:hypothetical protein